MLMLPHPTCLLNSLIIKFRSGSYSTGSLHLHQNFVNIDTAKLLESLGYTIDTSVICNASSPLNDLSSVKTLGKLDFKVLIFNELLGKKEVVPTMSSKDSRNYWSILFYTQSNID